MSAALLRAAAEKMRRDSEDATRGPWLHVEIEDEDGRSDSYVYALTGLSSIGEDVGESMTGADARHIACWHPDVTCHVADWLESTVSFVEMYGLDGADARGAQVARALAVARAYMKTEP